MSQNKSSVFYILHIYTYLEKYIKIRQSERQVEVRLAFCGTGCGEPWGLKSSTFCLDAAVSTERVRPSSTLGVWMKKHSGEHPARNAAL